MTDNMHALTGAYVLDALDPDERDAYLEHLRGCAECRDEVASLLGVATRLGASPAVAPPPELRAAVIAQVGRTAQSGPAIAPSGSHRVVRRWTRWPALAVAAAVTLLGVVGGTALHREREAAIASAAMQSKVMRIASAPDAVSVDVDLGLTHLVMSSEMQSAALMGEDVAMPSPAGAVYQLWMMHDDGSAAPGPTFVPHDGELMVVLEGDLADVVELAVTVEPRGGSPSPSDEMVAHIEL